MTMRNAVMPAPPHCRLLSLLSAALFAALLLCVPGCSMMTPPEEKPVSELVLAMPARTGTVMQVDAASSMDRDIHGGDIAITVNLDSGGSVIVIQPEDNIFTPGDRVRIIRSGETFVRVQVLTPTP